MRDLLGAQKHLETCAACNYGRTPCTEYISNYESPAAPPTAPASAEEGLYTTDRELEQTIRAAIVNSQGDSIDIGLTEAITQKLVAALRTHANSAVASEDANPWKRVLIEALIVNFILTDENKDDAEKALNDLMRWEQKVTLDPKVSKEAQELELEARKAEIELLKLASEKESSPAVRYESWWRGYVQRREADLTRQLADLRGKQRGK